MGQPLQPEEEQFLRGVETVQRRSLITVAIVVWIPLLLVAFLSGWVVGALRPPVPIGSTAAELTDQVLRLILLLKIALLVLLATVLAGVVGALVMITDSARQIKLLLGIIDRLKTGTG